MAIAATVSTERTISFYAWVAGAIASTLVIAKIGYLLAELLYNRTLILFGSAPGISEAMARNVESFGQHMAASGATLLVLGLCLKRLRTSGEQKANAAGAAIGSAWFLSATIVVGLGAYVGSYGAQTLLIRALVSYSGDQSAFNAYHATIYQQMLVNGMAPSGMPDNFFAANPDETRDLPYQTRAAMGLIPLALLDADDVINDMREDGRSYALRYARYRLYHDRFHEDYLEYRSAQKSIEEMWRPYRIAMLDAKRSTQLSMEQAREVIGAIYASASNRYVEYRNGEARFRKYILEPRLRSSNIDELHRWLDRYFAGGEVDSYSSQMTEYFGFVPDESAWCSEEQCPGGRNHIINTVRMELEADFKRRSGGMGLGLSRAELLRSEAVRERIKRATDKVLGIKSEVAPGYPAIRDHILSRAAETAARKMDVGVGDRQTTLGAGLSLAEFLRLPEVKSEIESRMPAKYQGVDLTLDQAEFFNRVWRPEADEQIARLAKEYWPNSASDFGDEKWSTERERALKAAYVMPLAMTLSFVFFVLNGISLLMKVPNNSSRRWMIGVAVSTLLLGTLALGTADRGEENDLPVDIPHGVQLIVASAEVIQPLGSVAMALAPDHWMKLLLPPSKD